MNYDLMIPISQLKSELKSLKKSDGGGFFRSAKLSVFGSVNHQYKLNCRLSEAELRDFEVRHSITLPADFRNFFQEIANGGAGPGYGLLKLQEWDKELQIDSKNFLSTPFLYEDKWNMHQLITVDDDAYFETEEFKQWENEYFDNKHVTGSIRISHYGCAIYYLLVVTGIERGHVWIDDRAGDYGIYPAVSKITNQKMTFSQWYHEWLDESLESLKR